MNKTILKLKTILLNRMVKECLDDEEYASALEPNGHSVLQKHVYSSISTAQDYKKLITKIGSDQKI
jgi:hypothetical protein